MVSIFLRGPLLRVRWQRGVERPPGRRSSPTLARCNGNDVQHAKRVPDMVCRACGGFISRVTLFAHARKATEDDMACFSLPSFPLSQAPQPKEHLPADTSCCILQTQSLEHGATHRVTDGA
jgi:hypothetical protein